MGGQESSKGLSALSTGTSCVPCPQSTHQGHKPRPLPVLSSLPKTPFLGPTGTPQEWKPGPAANHWFTRLPLAGGWVLLKGWAASWCPWCSTWPLPHTPNHRKARGPEASSSRARGAETAPHPCTEPKTGYV